ncbi:MAG: indole-3-glycerol phosphate synthase TrpC [Candidatus Tectomicrobia bacterium]|nr:indole-3-glycerol phosphate synthase TrpC [Candidatus Tectomicrobia bacterium]
MTIQSLTVLDELAAGVREDLAADRAAVPEEDLLARAKDAPPARGLAGALRMPSSGKDPDGARVRVIAEVKQASPSQGVIAGAFDPAAIARRYEAGGAAAISVLTERRRFLGSMGHLRAVRAAVSLPVLRKEFIFDPYQVLEARAGGADAILLIAAILETHEMEDLRLQAEELGMDALVEVYAGEEVERPLEAGARILGVNNRNLKTFEVDPGHTLRVLSRLPAPRRQQLIQVSESGISGWKEVAPLAEAGVDAVLVGESLMRAPSPEALLRELRGLLPA